MAEEQAAPLPSLVVPSLLASHRKQQRAEPPSVSPLRGRSCFRSDEEYRDYKRTRRKALERVREFNRPVRNRKGRDRPARRLEQYERAARRDQAENARLEFAFLQRQINAGIEVPVGRKKAPPNHALDSRQVVL